jgi:hypothetical protein
VGVGVVLSGAIVVVDAFRLVRRKLLEPTLEVAGAVGKLYRGSC